MVKRVLIDAGVGVVLAAGSQVLQYAAYLLLLLLGVSAPYDTAPPDPGSHPDWVRQISLMSLVAAAPVFAVTLLLAWLITTRGLGEGARRGLVWAVVVVLCQLAIGLVNGTQAVFLAPGMWAFVAAFALGPVVAGLLPARTAGIHPSARPHRMA
ncbi:MAG TPA: hypothetical protein VLS51_00020 [Propionibacteriaceae bacterium]|nr:hypothetical protein [Propionibacteriaceae bacterium]